ncbi:hypothetical protein SARC_02346 [Sphaeroforma arctica JP610]|uniref:Major facilitator superfamily (MFS) profile domain-containing protein n=1 Tax=Sphaeroforma arctica JP610 TaxID=667725 RepID=A0A0L0G9A9_9EUKA|nr:hypothetical protein SARC_02346 [Sphaeroforma arctica JP610]KNC85476.1 hypothetical protein SARC_02346 [Sphaeroforma arctica JP610]|eukprot:XP_014159378.1 hypothetical protein SARC_02346 [Sphaeroforma arctica JP610]
MLPLVPETPRWLRLQNRLTAPAQSAGVQRVPTSAQGLVTQRSAYTDILTQGTAEGTWGDILFPTAQTKSMLAAGLGIAIYQQVCGSEAVVYYTPTILVEAGVGPSQSDDTVLLCTMAVGFTKFLFAGLGAYTVERTVRRACAILSCGGTAVCLPGLAGAKRCDHPNGAVALLCLFMMYFESGLSPLPAVLGSEIYPMAIRARAVALGTFVNRIIPSCSAGVFPSMLHTLGAPNTFLVFGLSGATGVLYCYGIVPETKGLTLDDVESLFQSRAMADAKDCTRLASDADERDGKLG